MPAHAERCAPLFHFQTHSAVARHARHSWRNSRRALRADHKLLARRLNGLIRRNIERAQGIARNPRETGAATRLPKCWPARGSSMEIATIMRGADIGAMPTKEARYLDLS